MKKCHEDYSRSPLFRRIGRHVCDRSSDKDCSSNGTLERCFPGVYGLEQLEKNWAAYSSQYEHVSLTPGADETKLNYAWYSKTAETPKVRISTRQNMDGATEFTGAQTEAVTIDTTKYFPIK